eukprot:TRINITY_DN10184_c0_g2_i1.p1 TRINITY_DN10184_c0_g2~~TRINITY_DN10184_c0_g2_i1.p1  ORF type:complete len:527 (+),score=57.51 TRINITY_DN10184_c0_g2_i1:44-1582(+)
MAWNWRNLSCRRVIGLGLFVGSYFCLYFGLCGALVYYADTVRLEPSWFENRGRPSKHFEEKTVAEVIRLLGDKAKVPIIPATTRSLIADRGMEWSLLHALLDKAQRGESSYLPSYTLIFFGILLPAFKFFAVIYWMVSHLPSAGQAVTVAARLTRWTAVDAVAEAMIVALLLRSDVIAEHRVGYLCFITYVILSAAAIWVMDEADDTKDDSPFAARLLHQMCGCPIRPALTVLTGLGFLVTAAVGATLYPLAHLSVPVSSVKSFVEWTVIHPYRGMLKVLGEADDVERLINEILPHLPVVYGEASVAEAVKTLLWSGHVFTIAGSVMLFTGIMLCPALEAAMGIIVAFQASQVAHIVVEKEEESLTLLGEEDVAGAAASHSRSCAALVREMAGDLSMLDVFVAGMAVANAVLASLGDVMVTELDTGFWVLIGAVVLGWIHNTLCTTITYASGMRDAKNKAILRARSESKAQALAEDRKPQSSLFTLLRCSRPKPETGTLAVVALAQVTPEMT